MRSRRGSAAVALVLCCGAGCATRQPREIASLDRLRGLLTGSFSSAAQASQDPAFLDIRLHMTPIWTDRTDGPWLYVEQGRADAQDRPYRQRVYRLSRRTGPRGGEFLSEVFELPGDPLRFAGGWRDPALLSSIAPGDLVARAGCEVVLRATSGGFEGATVGKGCPSSLRGASYATSEVRVGAEGIESWDRGFDAAGRQVWGAETGGYRFLRD